MFFGTGIPFNWDHFDSHVSQNHHGEAVWGGVFQSAIWYWGMFNFPQHMSFVSCSQKRSGRVGKKHIRLTQVWNLRIRLGILCLQHFSWVMINFPIVLVSSRSFPQNIPGRSAIERQHQVCTGLDSENVFDDFVVAMFSIGGDLGSTVIAASGSFSQNTKHPGRVYC